MTYYTVLKNNIRILRHLLYLRGVYSFENVSLDLVSHFASLSTAISFPIIVLYIVKYVEEQFATKDERN